MKKILSLLLAITLLFTLGGCFNSNEDNITHEDVKNRVIDEATEYLKKTYPNDEFTYISGRSPNWAYPYYEIGFSSKNYDNQLVTVYGDPDDEANTEDGLTVYNYYDDYFQYYMKTEAENYFSNMAKEYIGYEIETQIGFETSIGASKLIDGNLSFEENLKKGQKGILPSFKCDYNLDSKKDKIYNLLEKLIQQDIHTLVRFQYKKDINDNYYTGSYKFTTYDGIIEEVK